MPANDRQVGGSHYKAEVEHWDVIEDYGHGYLEGSATAYVTRCRKRGHRDQDLEKAEHYVEKLMEKNRERGRGPRGHVPDPICQLFCASNGLTELESQVVVLLLQWRDAADLDRALRMIGRLRHVEE